MHQAASKRVVDRFLGLRVPFTEHTKHLTRLSVKATVLIHATNAFNSLNHQVALHNIRHLSPPIATILVNSYRAPSELFVDCDVILSQEGTAQGNPLAMAMYGLATIPLIRRLNGSYTNKSGTVMTLLPLPPLNIYAVTPNDQECALFALLAQHGGLGIRIPSKKELQSFQLVTSSLVSHILEQNQEYGYDDIADQLQSKATFRNRNKEMSSKKADNLYSHLPARLQKAVDLTKEKGASTWLTALPLKEHGLGCFHDAVVDGLLQISRPSATAATVSLLNMHSHVPKEVFPPSGTTKSMILWLISCVARCALNPNCSQLRQTNCLEPLQIHRMERGSMFSKWSVGWEI